MKRVLMAGAVALAAVTQAYAADLPPPMAPPPRAPAAYMPVSPAYNWSGFYIGLNAGYGFGNSNWNDPVFGTSGSFSVNGGQAGATLGYNYQISQLVLGIEGDYDWQNVRGSSGLPCGSCDTASNWIATVRGRVGYAFDRIMVYGTGGAAFTDVEASFAALPWQTNTKVGWTAGAGIEGAITDNLTAKIEYLYADFGNTSCGAANCGGTTTSVKFNESMVRAGLNYKFTGF
jgi:outer membrane immunogenic protein